MATNTRRMKYRHGGKEQLLSFGRYPEVSLAEARLRRDEARAVIRDGGDPAALKRARKLATKVAVGAVRQVLGTQVHDPRLPEHDAGAGYSVVAGEVEHTA